MIHLTENYRYILQNKFAKNVSCLHTIKACLKTAYITVGDENFTHTMLLNINTDTRFEAFRVE
jgi:hypothetical protein